MKIFEVGLQFTPPLVIVERYRTSALESSLTAKLFTTNILGFIVRNRTSVSH